MTVESDGGSATGGPEDGAFDGDLDAGEMVGKFRILKKIGEGGFGTVYKAVNDIEKLGAVKVLRHMYSADPEMVSRFKAEARSVNQIRHRNIIDIFEFGKLPDGRQYYVMEFLEGMPLDAYLDQRGRVSLVDAIPILRCIARALDAAHAKGIAHRDLKPENAFLLNDDSGALEAKLLDFGIAKLLREEKTSHKTRTGAPIGTPYYMSPEQARGRDVDHRTDIYAFGCVCYQMLTGEYPFDGEDYMEILLKQIGEEPKRPSETVADLSPAVDRAVFWMLEKDPEKRPPNLMAAVAALEEAAIAAGFDVRVTGERSSVRASATAPLLSQATPSPQTPAQLGAGPARAIGSAETIGVEPPGGIDAGAAGAKRRAVLVAGAVVAAVAAGLAAYGVLSGGEEKVAGERAVVGVGEGEPELGPRIPDSSAGSASDSPSASDLASDSTPDAAVLSAFVTLEIRGAPAGTEVFGPGGAPLGVAPGKVQLRRGELPVILTFQADAYRTASQEVVPSEDRVVKVKLERKRSARRGRAKGKGKGRGKGRGKGKGEEEGKADSSRNSIEDPF